MINVVLITGTAYERGLPALIRSLQANTGQPSRLRVYVLSQHDKEQTSSSQHHLRCAGIVTTASSRPGPGVVAVRTFGADYVTRKLNWTRRGAHARLADSANYARILLPDLLPHLKHALYMDVDMLVLGDVAKLWSTVHGSTFPVQGVPRLLPLSRDISKPGRKTFERHTGLKFDGTAPTFNTGLLGYNLRLWRKKRVTERVAWWLNKNCETPLWTLGTQPPLQLVAHVDGWTRLPENWNSVMRIKHTTLEQVQSAGALHWAGTSKPWDIAGPIPFRPDLALWRHFDRRRNNSCPGSPHLSHPRRGFVPSTPFLKVAEDRGRRRPHTRRSANTRDESAKGLVKWWVWRD